MILVRIARIIHAIICVAAFMVFVNHGSAQESDPSETVQTDVPSTPADLSRSTGSDCAAPVEGSQAIVFAPSANIRIRSWAPCKTPGSRQRGSLRHLH